MLLYSQPTFALDMHTFNWFKSLCLFTLPCRKLTCKALIVTVHNLFHQYSRLHLCSTIACSVNWMHRNTGPQRRLRTATGLKKTSCRTIPWGSVKPVVSVLSAGNIHATRKYYNERQSGFTSWPLQASHGIVDSDGGSVNIWGSLGYLCSKQTDHWV